MRLSKAIEIDTKRIDELENEIDILLKLGEYDKAIEKGKEMDKLIKAVNLAKVISL